MLTKKRSSGRKQATFSTVRFLISLGALTLTLSQVSITSPVVSMAQTAQDPDIIPNEVIVRFHEDRRDRAAETLAFLQSGALSRREFPFISHTMTLTFPDGVDVARKIEQLRRNPQIRFVDFNYRLTLSAIPNDTNFSLQWNLHNTGQSGGVSDVDIDAPDAWSNSTGDPNLNLDPKLMVAIVDTGVRATHQDLSANLTAGWNFVTNNTDVNDDSPHGHGTTIAGIIGAVGPVEDVHRMQSPLWRSQEIVASRL